MRPRSVLRFNFVLPGADPDALSERYRAGVEMAAYADRHGVDAVSLEEHHLSDDGWLPAPLTVAGAVLGATRQLRVSVQALLLPLHDPVRIAEQLAVLDLLGGGRLAVTVGLGYRPEEYAAAGVRWDTRGAAMDCALETLLAVWSGEPVEHDGRRVVASPVPRTPAAQMVSVGGSSRPAARRAARLGLPMVLPDRLPGLAEYYEARCAEAGTRGAVVMPPADTAMVVLAEDPERGWDELGPHLLHEATRYRSWQTAGVRSGVASGAGTVAELRAEGIYQVLAPEQLVRHCREQGDGAAVVLHPLCGGIPVDRGWETLRLFTEQVLPHLDDDGR
ncbi:Hydride transferase 1 [Pseudonocardia sp. Ae168_Ps1]|uniref:LLM class flavin-dependent oxidoreductase n=1 Tax=unclassified Pseudonocardia TaxID=2619320 RepID=UPI00094B1BA3|nr:MULTISPECIES: LLM class flavin-dependent oxidoreductase [unclassified Pseudonocardia]OLL71939.1 Hydride transferase 1 [Pseudonocardia sp. Ae150A_Ps1]OLL77906.1 Hydride transferase 1 [Pseudonocardia sp. Ae168_Ps1]OLL87971.1 Hydride transferase 1 [Pseudonocardia sp. Ae263_Ps1]OLL92004.1 Hydride transferase 1 [Pseudonocardia sp. Ae356_Ps1]